MVFRLKFLGILHRAKIVFSLRSFLLITNIIILLLFLSIVLFLMIQQNESILKRSNIETEGAILSQVEEKITSYFSNIEKKIESLIGLMEKELSSKEIFDQKYFLDIASNLLSFTPSVRAIYFSDLKGNLYQVIALSNGITVWSVNKNTVAHNRDLIAWRTLNGENIPKSVPSNYIQLNQNQDPRATQWYQSAKLDRGTWTGPFPFSESAYIGMIYANQISSGYLGGVLAVDVDLSGLSQNLEDLSYSNIGSIIIKSQGNKLIAFSDVSKQDQEIGQITFNHSHNRQSIALREVDSIKSSPELSYFSQNIAVLPLEQALIRGKLSYNILDTILALLFPKYTKSSNIRSILLNGVTSNSTLFKGSKYIYSMKLLHPFPEEQWIAYMFTRQDQIGSSMGYLLRITMFLFIGFLIIFIVLLNFTSNLVASPLARLSHSMDNFSRFMILSETPVRKHCINIVEIEKISHVYSDLQNGFRSFQKFVPDVIVKRSLNHSFLTDGKLNSKMNKQDISILFSDIEGFTSISERISPEVLCRCLDIYFSAMSEEIQVQNGMIDKFIGDAIMVLFGAFPDKEIEDEQKIAVQAVFAALGMRARAEWMNCQIKEIQDDVVFKTRIGISTGEVMIGVMGSAQRLNFTAIGDMVNLASRLEGVNKIYKTSIIICNHTRDLVDSIFMCRYLGKVEVRGKKEKELIYELVHERALLSDIELSYYSSFNKLQEIIDLSSLEVIKKAVALVEFQFPSIQDPVFAAIKAEYQ